VIVIKNVRKNAQKVRIRIVPAKPVIAKRAKVALTVNANMTRNDDQLESGG